jgi:hypothetical protein
LAYLDKSDLKTLYTQSKTEAHIWREGYPAYERLMNNDLLESLDPNLPEVNEGSLSAALFKLPKRIVNKQLSGTVKATNRDEAWLGELANLQWENEIIPNANTQAPFIRKWKEAVRKAAGYGSVPLITLSIEKNDKTYTDFIVAQPQDVTLEPGKVSDYDSDVIFWDVYYTKLQLENMIEQAKAEQKESPEGDGYNKWDIPGMEKILESKNLEERESMDTPRGQLDRPVRPQGYKFCIAFQRGVDAPFYMYHKETDTTIREWSNPDPTGDVPVHFLYCYQDFVNPYGIGIVKLAGGTQNVLDYMRQADILATQLGIRPPILLEGVLDDTDLESFVYQQDAHWEAGTAKVQRMEMSNAVYEGLPGRMSQYQTSLQKLIPTGDTSATSSDSGDPNQSKTPAGVKLQAANLSIDDEDFKDNLYITYQAKAKSMINTHFANMEGTDFMKVSDDERELLMKGGLEFPQNADGEMSNQVEMAWDSLRADFDFEVDPESDKVKDDADKLDGLTKVADLVAADPTLDQDLLAAGKKLNKGELYAEIIALTSDNDKIITDISPDEKAAQAENPQAAADPNAPQQKTPSESVTFKDAVAAGALDTAAAMAQQAGLPADDIEKQRQAKEAAGVGGLPVNPRQPSEVQVQPDNQTPQSATDASNPSPTDAAAQPDAAQELSHGGVSQSEIQANVDAVMQQYGVDEETALTALAAEHAGLPVEDVIAHVKEVAAQQQGAAA